MTLLDTRSAVPPPPTATAPPTATSPAPTEAPRGRPPAHTSPVRQVAATAVIILATTLLGFVMYLGAISRLHHAHAQHTAYANFRKALANATAPVGQTQPAHPGKLLALGTPVGVLRIPEIGLAEVVFEGTTGGVLQMGPGHLRDTSLPGQAGVSEIMGRAAAYGGPFGRLSELGPGQTFTVTTGQGVQIFRVLGVRRAGDPQRPMVSGASRLVLATADGTPFLPSGVLRVDADLVSPVQPTPAMVLGAADLPAAEHAMATDPSAWYPLVLWGQCLVLVAALIAWTRIRWGRWQIWIVVVPVLGFLGLAVADEASRLLPNLL